MKTMKGWDESKACFTMYVQDGDEVDSKIYDYFLGVVPPHKMTKEWFLMGEPYDTNQKGEMLYMAFSIRGMTLSTQGIEIPKYYYLGISTEAEMGA